MKNRVDHYTPSNVHIIWITHALLCDISSGSVCAPYAEHTSGCTSMSSVSWSEPLWRNSAKGVFHRSAELFVDGAGTRNHCSLDTTPQRIVRGGKLTLRLLMSYIYGAPNKARNVNVVYIWTYVWQRWNSLFLFAAQCFNTESMQRGFLCHICV